ncbi:hypothetical protein Leryth_015600 [Lithospermum erythrorhizon]|nr:hypothetical protein Leryth_015600 [Lithospermum erythrorhizon]
MGTRPINIGILLVGGDGEITVAHLLLGIWLQKESAGYTIMSSLGFDDEKANELEKSMDAKIIKELLGCTLMEEEAAPVDLVEADLSDGIAE